MRRCAAILAPAVISASILHAAADPAALFRSRIQPVFARECEGCHGARQQLSGLDLRTREAALEGGARGPAMAPGNAAASLLYQVLTGAAEKGKLQMPPAGSAKKLPAETIAAVKTWIDAGAPWTAEEARPWNSAAYKDEDLWAFRPVRPRDKSRSMDSFIAEKIEAARLIAAPRADRRTLIRRVTIDLSPACRRRPKRWSVS